MASIAEDNNHEEIITGIPDLLDPNLLKSARDIYNTYCHFRSKLTKTPMGVAINRKTHRGQLLFGKKPILLPWENFIPIDQIQSEIY